VAATASSAFARRDCSLRALTRKRSTASVAPRSLIQSGAMELTKRSNWYSTMGEVFPDYSA